MADTLAILNAVNVAVALNPPVFDVVQTATTTSIPSGTGWTPVAFSDGAGVIVDSYSGHSTSVNPSRYVGMLPGYYEVSGVVCFTSNATGSRGALLSKNGTLISGSGQSVSTNATGSTAVASARRLVFLNGTTDYVELVARQQSGGSLTTAIFTDISSAFTVTFKHL
jgi:hypothetical protein